MDAQFPEMQQILQLYARAHLSVAHKIAKSQVGLFLQIFTHCESVNDQKQK